MRKNKKIKKRRGWDLNPRSQRDRISNPAQYQAMRPRHTVKKVILLFKYLCLFKMFPKLLNTFNNNLKKCLR